MPRVIELDLNRESFYEMSGNYTDHLIAYQPFRVYFREQIRYYRNVVDTRGLELRDPFGNANAITVHGSAYGTKKRPK